MAKRYYHETAVLTKGQERRLEEIRTLRFSLGGTRNDMIRTDVVRPCHTSPR